MAFKLDFAALDRTIDTTPRCPYAGMDAVTFRDKNLNARKIHKGRVRIDIDERRHSMVGDLMFKARVEGRDDAITVIFTGQRADDFKEGRVTADAQALHEARCAQGDFDSPLLMDVEVEGAWFPRKWKDRTGAWHTGWEMQVARWTYTAQDGQVVTEGCLPQL